MSIIFVHKYTHFFVYNALIHVFFAFHCLFFCTISIDFMTTPWTNGIGAPQCYGDFFVLWDYGMGTRPLRNKKMGDHWSPLHIYVYILCQFFCKFFFLNGEIASNQSTHDGWQNPTTLELSKWQHMNEWH